MIRTEQVSSVLREAVDVLLQRDRVNLLTPAGLTECYSHPPLLRNLRTLLHEGMSAETVAGFDVLMDNARTQFFRESSLASVQPLSTLVLPMLRKAWPKIGVKEALPTTPVKVPKFSVPHLIPFIKDPVTGERKELPAALRDTSLGTSVKRVSTTARALPLNKADIAPAGTSVATGYSLDRIFSVAKVNMIVTNAAGASAETLTDVKVTGGVAETRQGMIRFEVSGAHSSGHVTSDLVFGFVNFQDMTITLTSLNTSATAAHAQVTHVTLNGRCETTNNKQATVIGFENKNTEISIGTGEHFEAPLPLEWLTDTLAMYQIDGTLKVVDIMTEVLAQKVDLDGLDFVDSAAEAFADTSNVSFDRTFDVYPTGNYNGSPTEWLNELKRICDNLAQTILNHSNMSGGHFCVIGNPIDINLFAGVNWIFTAQGEGQRDGVAVNYSLGAMSGAVRYAMFSSQNVTPGVLRVLYVPDREEFKTLEYFPYSFNVERSSSGFVSPNTPNVPSVLMTKRQHFETFNPLVGKITILHNDGTLPA